MTFFVCVSLSVFFWGGGGGGGESQRISAPGQNSESQKVHAYDALANAYTQFVENKMPVRKAAKL